MTAGDQPFRLAAGGLIDRGRPLAFSFDGKAYRGYDGDTLASALLANGVRLVGRSFKYHRPRGVFGAGAEEPNALVRLGRGPRAEPNLRATQVSLVDGLEAWPQNCWPSLGFDLGRAASLAAALLPSGFYYKTFMWPARWWRGYEHFIRKAAGLGRAPEGADPDRYEARHAHCDVLVVGGGPAGLMAALVAARTGAVFVSEADEEWRRLLMAVERPERAGVVRVADSAAIALYLADRYPSAGLAPPVDDAARGDYLYWMTFTPGVIEPAMSEKFNDWQVSRATSGWGDFPTMIEVLERGLQPGPWLLGERFSAADVLVGSSVYFMKVFGVLPDSAILHEYCDRCLARPAYQKALARDAELDD